MAVTDVQFGHTDGVVDVASGLDAGNLKGLVAPTAHLAVIIGTHYLSHVSTLAATKHLGTRHRHSTAGTSEQVVDRPSVAFVRVERVSFAHQSDVVRPWLRVGAGTPPRQHAPLSVS